MPRYLVTLVGTRRVEGLVTIVASSAADAMAVAAQSLDAVVRDHIEWETDYDTPVSFEYVLDAQEVED
jgi:hypothetical protein